MLIKELANQCKEKGKVFQKGNIFLIEQNLNQHGDFLTVSWMINELESQRKVAFIAFRENYAHFVSLSKKLGKSIQPYLKSKQLKYYECFQNSFCTSELPLAQTSPNSYIAPPTTVKKLKPQQLFNENLFQQDSTVIIDAISFVDPANDIIIKIYEQALEKNCRIVLGGAMQRSKLIDLLKRQADIHIRLENDVGNHARLKINGQNWELSLLWKHVQGKFEVNQYIKL